MLQDIEADAPVGVNVGVEHLGDKLDLGRLIWVLLRKLYRQVETAPVPNRVLGAKNDSFPVEERVTGRCCRDSVLSGILVHFLQVFQEASFRVTTHFTFKIELKGTYLFNQL